MRPTVNTELNYWIGEFVSRFGDAFTDEHEGLECVEQVIERALESFEVDLRSALMDEMNEIIDRRHCCDCGNLITDENRPTEETWFGPDSGYCDVCAARNE